MTYTSTDAAGNTATCSFQVVVNGEPLFVRDSFLYLAIFIDCSATKHRFFLLICYCHFVYLSSDVESPVINGCPGNQSGVTDSGIATGTVSWTAPTATDNSGTQTLTSTHNPGDPFPIGTTTVTYTAIDAAGNTDTCNFDVVINGKPLFCQGFILISCNIY